jgi:excinuclease ABC subunit A
VNPSSTTAFPGQVQVRGAREHNLRNLSLDLPRDAFVVFTGVSGSGKSSLAFGTLYAESQRRFLESVAPYARRLLDQVTTPDVDDIRGLPPAVALKQGRGGTSVRSTVGTITQISNVLRMLYSRAGDYPEGAEKVDSDAFSPNTVVGACPTCHGLGIARTTSEALLVPDPSLSIREGAIAAWPGAWLSKNYRELLREMGYNIDKPWRELSREDRDWILFTDEEPVLTVHRPPEEQPMRDYKGAWQSVEKYVFRTYNKTESAKQRERLEAFMEDATCPDCHGKRLRPESLAITFEGRDITQMTSLPLVDLVEVLTEALADDGRGAMGRSGSQRSVAASLGKDVLDRIDSVVRLGLGYLSLDRPSTTLSLGELQRLRIATQIRSGLFGVVYVLDEPSAGLHPADADALFEALLHLRDTGNSLFVVEHDLGIARRAQWLVDIGPDAGEHGGEIIYSGPPEGLRGVPESRTAPFMFPDSPPEIPEPRPIDRTIRLSGLDLHNLKNVSVEVPLGACTAITGVSGSGKSSLLAGIAEKGPHAEGAPGRLVTISQKPIGRSPRSNPATYTGLFDGIRKVFASTDEARTRRYSASRFSFNVKGGRCETCEGEGYIKVELLFMPENFSPCPTCNGTRYNDETLAVTYKGHTIAEVLDLTVDRALPVFEDVPLVARGLRALQDVGLGYITLGHPATDLSGGEAQRVKLATELQRSERGDTLYLLDEPAAGLHPVNVLQLLRVFDQLVEAGNTVVIAEHNMHVVARADWVIEMGPEGGDRGGEIVAAMTPRDLARNDANVTAPYLCSAMGLVPVEAD